MVIRDKTSERETERKAGRKMDTKENGRMNE